MEPRTKSSPLPIGIVIPTRNAMGHLPDHVAALQELLPHVEEVVVVDSESSDGTAEYLRKHLRHPRLRLLERPPGLWESWNEGIRHVGAEWTYISTVGDSISLDGLRALLRTAEELACDVVVSPPRFEFEVRWRADPWPIHELVGRFGVDAPARLPRVVGLLLAATRVPDSILGSSASNLYRTRHLQERPFPTDFGRAGDTAWGVMYALETRFGIHPECVSSFLHHHKPRSEVDGLTRRRTLVALASNVLRGELRRLAREPGENVEPDALRRLLLRWLREMRHADRYRCALAPYRGGGGLPWVFSPTAWSLRRRKNRHWHRAARRREAVDRYVAEYLR